MEQVGTEQQAMNWNRNTPGQYTSVDGYTIKRETYVNSFSETRTSWRVTRDGRLIWVEPTLAKAKRAAERDAAKKAAGLCWFPSCGNPATGTTPGRRVSLPDDIDTCDACHQRSTGRPR